MRFAGPTTAAWDCIAADGAIDVATVGDVARVRFQASSRGSKSARMCAVSVHHRNLRPEIEG